MIATKCDKITNLAPGLQSSPSNLEKTIGLSPQGIQVIISTIKPISLSPNSKQVPKHTAGITIIFIPKNKYELTFVNNFHNAKVDKTIPVKIIESGPTQADAVEIIDDKILGMVSPVTPTTAPKTMAMVIGFISFLILPELLVKIA